MLTFLRVLVVEAYGNPSQIMPFYEYNGKAGAHLPLNLNLINLKKGCDGECVYTLVDNWMNSMDSKYWASWLVNYFLAHSLFLVGLQWGSLNFSAMFAFWQLGTSDHSRVATRLGQEFTNAANMLLMTLPGTAFTYYGEEIGMHDVDISYADTMDRLGKDKGPVRMDGHFM